MQGREAVVFRGDRHGLSLQIAHDAPFGDVIDELRRKLNKAADFFRGAQVRIESGQRPTDEVETRLLHELMRAHGMKLAGEAQAERADDRPAKVAETRPDNGSATARRLVDGALASRSDNTAEREPCLLVERTLRSGQRIEYDGSVVVLGDVNPGADVVATGSIVVLGALRGMVHAGAGGSTEVRVVALRLHPTQLRIANYISRPPDGEPPEAAGPEVALISGEHIQIERFQP